MIEKIRQVFSRGAITRKDGWIFANYSGASWITQTMDKAEFLSICSKAEAFSIRINRKFISIGFRLPDVQPQHDFMPQTQPGNGNLVIEESNEKNGESFYDYAKEHALLGLSTEELVTEFGKWAFPDSNVTNLSAVRNLRQMRRFLLKISSNGFYCDTEVNEVNGDGYGFITLYVDRDSRFPTVIDGELKCAFEGLISASGGFYFDAKPDEGFLTLQFIT